MEKLGAMERERYVEEQVVAFPIRNG